MVILSAFSAVLGLLRDVVIAGVYGSGAALDAYLYAHGLMNLVLALIAGAMAKAVVPPLARAAVSGDSRRADRMDVSLDDPVIHAGRANIDLEPSRQARCPDEARMRAR